MAFSFGQTPASTPGGFSFSSTPAFGAQASLPKAASTPLFGATPASSTPAFGASSSSLFGASSAAGSPFSFGAASSAAAAPSFSFGPAQPAQSQPSLFGAASAATPSFFGAAPASSPSFFGAASTPAASPFGGTSLFGTPQQQPNAGALSFAGAAPPAAPDLSAIRELESIRDSYVPSAANPRFRFQYFFLNVVENPAARVKPAGVDELAWREALQRAGGPDNPDHLWPVLAQGFKDLLARKAAQDAAIKEHNERLEALSAMAAQLASRQEAVLRQQLEGVRKRHVQLCHQLLRLLRHIDALEGRYAQAVGYRGAPKEVMQRLSSQLSEIEAGLAPSAANGGGLQGKVAALAAAARLRAGAPGAGSAAELEQKVDPEALEQMFGILRQYTEALQKMTDVLKRDERHVAMLEYAASGEKLE